MNPRKAVCFLGVLLIASVALAQGTYTQIDVPNSPLTAIYGIDTAGDIVGSYADANSQVHGFLLSGGVYTTIDYPGESDNNASGINDHGQIVGYYYGSPGAEGFLYDVQAQTFAPIRFPVKSDYTFPLAINNGGTIVGFIQLSPAGGAYGFELVGQPYRKVLPQGFASSFLRGINDSGEAVVCALTTNGHRCANFLFAQGKFHPLKIPAHDAYTLGISSTGTSLVGLYEPAPGIVAGFLFQNKTLQTLQFPGSNDTVAAAVNSAGKVAGYFYDSSNIPHGFTWTPPADAMSKGSSR